MAILYYLSYNDYLKRLIVFWARSTNFKLFIFMLMALGSLFQGCKSFYHNSSLAYKYRVYLHLKRYLRASINYLDYKLASDDAVML